MLTVKIFIQLHFSIAMMFSIKNQEITKYSVLEFLIDTIFKSLIITETIGINSHKRLIHYASFSAHSFNILYIALVNLDSSSGFIIYGGII